MQEFEILKQQAMQELKGFETEQSEHNTTLENLEQHNISKDEAIIEIVQEHLKENPNYYGKEKDCGCEHEKGGKIDPIKYRILTEDGKIKYAGTGFDSWFSLEKAKEKVDYTKGEMIYEWDLKTQEPLWEVFGRGGSLINKRMKYPKYQKNQDGKYGIKRDEDIEEIKNPDWLLNSKTTGLMSIKIGDYIGVKTKEGFLRGFVKDIPEWDYLILDNNKSYNYQDAVFYENVPKEEKTNFDSSVKDNFTEQRQLLDEFFTPKYIGDIMYKIALKYGFKGGKCLEPSFGGGVFIDVLLENGIKENDIWGFEIFENSFKEGRLKYPKANLINHNFEYEFAKETKALNRDGIYLNDEFKKTEFDLVIGNPPYGSHKSPYSYLFDTNLQTRIEGFFIYLSLQKLKKGGLLVFIINSLWLYNGEKYNKQKQKIYELADMIDAYRIPNNIFKGENRDTSIATDIVVFRKR